VEYDRNERFAGESKYPLKKMLGFALNGITSFSVKPIRMITGIGFTLFVLSILALIYILIVKLTGHAIVGWSSLTVSIWMLGGIQLLSIGIIGEYIAKTYLESKKRPQYFIENSLMD
jgi:glycosyltransferase involved in cell wall biosynthesis